MSVPRDEIQEACIARMKELGLNSNRVAAMVDGKVSRRHVCDYLSHRSGMGTHKAQHLMRALGLQVVVAGPGGTGNPPARM
jgi:hypothetical protein